MDFNLLRQLSFARLRNKRGSKDSSKRSTPHFAFNLLLHCAALSTGNLQVRLRIQRKCQIVCWPHLTIFMFNLKLHVLQHYFLMQIYRTETLSILSAYKKLHNKLYCYKIRQISGLPHQQSRTSAGESWLVVF